MAPEGRERPRASALPGRLVVGFACAWGALAWADWFFLTGPAARAMPGGALFAPHLLALLAVSAGLAVAVATMPLGVRWSWRLAAAAVPGSYAAFRWLG